LKRQVGKTLACSLNKCW